MEKNDVKELGKIFEPMNKYYSMLLKEKLNEEAKAKAYNNYVCIVEGFLNKHKSTILATFSKKEIPYEDKDFFEELFYFLKEECDIEEAFPASIVDITTLWEYFKSDVNRMQLLGELRGEVKSVVVINNRNDLKLFVEKYFIIAQKEQELEDRFIPDSTWLIKEAYEHDDKIPSSAGEIVNILKGKLRVPRLKVRKTISPQLRKDIGDRDGWKCMHCGIDLSKKESASEINHIDCNPSNNDPLNLELTCRNCNKKWRV